MVKKRKHGLQIRAFWFYHVFYTPLAPLKRGVNRGEIQLSGFNANAPAGPVAKNVHWTFF